MSSEIFRAEWTHHHNGLPPVAWLLRKSPALPWVRFHALPESKRYAENEAETQEILRRANLLADSTLGHQASCWLVTASYFHVDADPDPDPDPMSVWQIADPDDLDGKGVWRFHATPVIWRRRESDALLLEIADDRSFSILWLNRLSGAIFAPYDGGFDLFPGSSAQVAALRARYSDWLSADPNGL